MDTAREEQIRDVFEEIARNANLDRALTLVAEQIAADMEAPTCKIWVVKRGDICESCPLADSCGNRQMCLHLSAVSGAALDKEYPRIPMAILNASLIARGGTFDFNEAHGTSNKLFGLQHGAPGDSRDTYLLYPLRGASGTIGLIGVFNHRAIEAVEAIALGRLAPAASAAIRVAELNSRCELFRTRLEKETEKLAALERSSSYRETELQAAVAQLTREVVQTQMERDKLLQADNEVLQQTIQLEEKHRDLKDQLHQLTLQYQERERAAAEALMQAAAFRQQLEEEKSALNARIDILEMEAAKNGHRIEAANSRLSDREREIEALRSEIESREEELFNLQESSQTVQNRQSFLADENQRLREQNATLSESLDDLQSTLRVKDESKAKLEEIRLELEQQLVSATEENSYQKTVLAALQEKILHLDEALARGQDGHQQLVEANRKAAEQNAVLAKERDRLHTLNADLHSEVQSIQAQIVQMEASLTALYEAGQEQAETAQYNQLLREQNRQLAVESRRKSQFMANLAHELRTPMNAIIGFTSLLLDDPALRLAEAQQSNLERVARNARELLAFINNLLDLSKMDAGRLELQVEEMDVREIIQASLRALEGIREACPVPLRTDLANDLPALQTDKTRLQQILFNLLSNALKFTRAGEVKVTAAKLGEEGVQISVSDTGIGIAPSDLEKIFEEFRQADNQNRAQRTGTGLGLAITKRLVQLLGGEISVTSQPGQGSQFTVTLPLAVEARTNASDLAFADTEHTALIVSNDASAFYVIKKYLAEVGYAVAAAKDGVSGVEIALMAEPRAIVFDLDSIVKSQEGIRRIRAHNAAQPVIAISSNASDELPAIKAGASAFIVKPLTREALIKALNPERAAEFQRVLVVEDDPDTLTLLVTMLDGHAAAVHTASDGEQALEEVERFQPDVVVLDLMLPEMDGFEFVHRLAASARGKALPIVLVTAADLTREERLALDTGRIILIQKGEFGRDDLLTAIRTVRQSTTSLSVS